MVYGFLVRNAKEINDKSVIVRLYKFLVLSRLEYASVISEKFVCMLHFIMYDSYVSLIVKYGLRTLTTRRLVDAV